MVIGRTATETPAPPPPPPPSPPPPPTEMGLWAAAYAGSLQGVKDCIALGVAPGAQDPIKGSSALHWACFGGHLSVVRWLVKDMGVDPNTTNNEGRTPFFFACEAGHLGVAQWMAREANAEVNVRDGSLQTALHRACYRARKGSSSVFDEDLLVWMITEAGADLHAVDRMGNKVEDLSSPRGVTKADPKSRISEMVQAARVDGLEETKQKLTRRNILRRASAGDINVQLSPKMDVKQRLDQSRGSRISGSSSSISGPGGVPRRLTSTGTLLNPGNSNNNSSGTASAFVSNSSDGPGSKKNTIASVRANLLSRGTQGRSFKTI
ncbi:unnamed protein product, partial [Discosporangium mesarthrocarpum]